MNRVILLVSVMMVATLAAAKEKKAAVDDLEHSIQTHAWRETAQTAKEILAKDPHSSIARLKGAYALFQLGYSNSALLLLSQIRPDEWRDLPEGQDRLAEVVSLLQKKVPMNILPSRMDQVRLETASPFLIDEIRFNKGREAFEKGRGDEARQVLQAIPQRSRYYAQAHYLLGTQAVKMHDYATAQAEFSKVFLPSVFEQSSELWHDINSQISSHWGPKVKVALDGDLITENRKVGELAVLALARVAYGQHDYLHAVAFDDKIAKESRFYPRATLEKIWALLMQKKHDEAEKVAAALSLTDTSFEALEARPLRALVLVDAGRTVDARKEIDEFKGVSAGVQKSIQDFHDSQGVVTNLPPFLQTELKNDTRLTALAEYQKTLEEEISDLGNEDHRLFPCFERFASELAPLLAQARGLQQNLISEHVSGREADLTRLALRADLIRVESFLEDRERLRSEYRAMKSVTEQQQLDHDQRLYNLLKSAIDGVDAIYAAQPGLSEPRLEFRQSELLWEFGNISIIIGQTTKDPKRSAEGDGYRVRALKSAQAVLKKYPKFVKYPQAFFFVGFAQIELGQTNQGLATLQSYVKEFPHHQHAPDAYRILGDARFDVNDFRGAEAQYKHVLEFPDSPIVGYALYKIGWAAYNERDFARTLLGLEKAIVWNNRAGKEGQILTLQREAEHDLIQLYAEFGDHRKAREYFAQFLPGDQKPWLEKLAAELDRNGQFEKSGDIYRMLVVMDPAAPESSSYDAKIIFGCQQLHRWPDAVRAAERLAQSYKSKLVNPQPDGTPAAAAEKIVREAVLTQLYEYKKRSTPEGAKNVEALDKLYFAMFKQWPGAELPLYRHAHFLLNQGRNAEAAAFFELHWSQFGSGLKEPQREEALRNLIFALNQSEQEIAGTPGKLAPAAADIVKYSTEYEKDYPATEHTRAIVFLRASLLYKYHQGDRAVGDWQKLFDANSSDDIGKRSFQNLRASYYANKDWQKTDAWANGLLARPNIAAYASDLKTIRAEAQFLMNDGIKDDVTSAEGFLKLAAEPIQPDLHDKCLYNAFVRYNKAGRKMEALNVADQLQKTSPKYDGLSAIAGLRAALYQDAGDYERAGPLLDQFLAAPPPDTAKEALAQARLNSGLINEALGHVDQAKRSLETYVKENPDGKGVTEAKRALDRLQSRRSTASREESPKWRKLRRLSAEFEQHPVPIGTNIPHRIKLGAQELEAAAKAYVDASNDPAAPADDAFEMYCKVPLFYAAYAKSVLALGRSRRVSDQERTEFTAELEKIVEPIQAKAADLAKECLKKSAAAEHDGPNFRAVHERWGWPSEPQLAQKINAVMSGLQAQAPWFDAVTAPANESDIFKKHFDTGGTEDTWYALSRMRWQENKPGLSRLTAVDALSRFPKSGRLLNALAVYESQKSDHAGNLFQTAGEQGSASAWVNLALYHLKGARLTEARFALKKAIEAQAFRAYPDLEKEAKEIM